MNIEPPYGRSPHVCRHCLGPILQYDGGFICAVCDAAAGAVEVICGCGIKVAGSSARRGFFRCTANPARGPASPAAIVITFGAQWVDEVLAGACQCS
jgi:hypothetical protein